MSTRSLNATHPKVVRCFSSHVWRRHYQHQNGKAWL